MTAKACLLLLLPLAAPAPRGPSPAEDAARPNLLFVFSDDHALAAIGAYGGRLAALDPTPNLDRLAREGMLFEASFCTNSICGPSRAVVLTGKHSHRNGFRANGQRFDGAQPTFPKLLQAAGYATGMIGKWHLGSEPQGFDHWDVLPGQGAYYNPRFVSAAGERRVAGYCTDIITDLAVAWMEERRTSGEPFLLMCQYKAPHRNWMPALRHLDLWDDVELPEPPSLFDDLAGKGTAAHHAEMSLERDLDLVYDLFVEPYDGWDPERGRANDGSGFRNLSVMTTAQRAAWDAAFTAENTAFVRAYTAGELSDRDVVRWKYQRYLKNYLRSVRGVDEGVGRLLDYLDESGLAGNTVVTYSSDQGFYLGEHGWFDKRWMYEESLAMPLIVRWPGVTSPGSRNTDLVQNLDYAETFLDIAGVPVPADMQGRSLVPLLRGETPPDWRDAIYYHYHGFPDIHRVARHYGVRTQRYKLIRFYQLDEWELYDLERDPLELHDLYAEPEYRDTAVRLAEELGRLRERCADDTDTTPFTAEERRAALGPR